MTIAECFSKQATANGFGWLRLVLAVGILSFHSVTVTYGNADGIADLPMALAGLILPMFFALSGFLVAASLDRAASLPQFLFYRLIRLMPALTVVVVFTALLLGPLTSRLGVWGYFADPHWPAYLANIAARPQYFLPGVFAHNPRPGVVNGSLWTIPVELCCYLALAVAAWLGLTRRKPVAALANLGLLLGLSLGALRGFPDWLAQFPIGELIMPFLAGVTLFCLGDRLPCRAQFAAGLFLLALTLSWSGVWLGLAALALAYVAIWAGLRSLPALPGDYSYGLYLTGYPLQQLYVWLFPGGSCW